MTVQQVRAPHRPNTTLDDGYYLFGFDADGNWKTLDGVHSEPSGVRQALYLIEGMNLSRDIAFWKIVYIGDVEPADDGTTNHEAMRMMGALVRKGQNRAANRG